MTSKGYKLCSKRFQAPCSCLQHSFAECAVGTFKQWVLEHNFMKQFNFFQFWKNGDFRRGGGAD